MMQFSIMVRIFFVFIFSLLFHLTSSGQWSCGHPAGGMVVLGQPPLCYPTAPGDTVDICFTFTAPGSILLFTSLPGGSCSTVEASAVLYDDSCNVVYSNAFGQFVYVVPGNSYVWCLHYVCTGTHATVFCPYYQDYSALPVILSHFEGTYSASDDAVNLVWITDGEFNNDNFLVEHTSSWENAYKVIGIVQGSGTTTASHVYHFQHKLFSAGYNFYRLRQVDFDGHSTYSNVVMVKSPQFDSVTWTVYDISGRRIKKISNDELRTLAKGFYLLEARNAVIKFLK